MHVHIAGKINKVLTLLKKKLKHVASLILKATLQGLPITLKYGPRRLLGDFTLIYPHTLQLALTLYNTS